MAPQLLRCSTSLGYVPHSTMDQIMGIGVFMALPENSGPMLGVHMEEQGWAMLCTEASRWLARVCIFESVYNAINSVYP